MKFKKCTKCCESLALSNFYKGSNYKDGLRPICKECTKLSSKKYYEKNKQSIVDKRKENKEQILDYIKEWQKNNQEKVASYKKKWKKDNPEKVKLGNKLYYSKPEIKKKMNLHVNLRRARKAKLEATLTKDEWENAKLYFNNCCAYCGTKETLTKDHFIPVVKKGGYTKENIIPACRSCNCSKNKNDFDEWYPNQEFYSKETENKILTYLKNQYELKGCVNYA